MKTDKQTAIEAIKNLPDEASFDDIMERLYVIQKIEAGLTDIEEGRVHSL